MGSQAIQEKLWGREPKDWASIQEQTGRAGYLHALKHLQLKAGDTLLDVGCGTGLFCGLASAEGAAVTGIDATGQLIAEARLRYPSLSFLTGEMEELPFADGTFDVVCGFNSFQYAASTKNALAEAYRVLKNGGQLVAMIWGNKEDCEAAGFLKAVGGLLPPPPPGAPGPFALSENKLLEKILEEAAFKIEDNTDVVSIWDYPDTETALKGLMATGPVTRAIENSGFQTVRDTILASMQPYIQSSGHVVYRNKFRVVIANK